MSITTMQDVHDAYEGTIPAERSPWLEGRIRAAELIIAQRIGDLTAWVGDDMVRRARLVEVVARMVLRLVRNPDGLTSQNETAGPFSYGTQIDQRVASGNLWLTDDDLALLGLNGVDLPCTMRARLVW